MGSSVQKWGTFKTPSTTYYIDSNTPYTTNLQNGSEGLPYNKVQQAIDDGYAKGLIDMTINLAIGTYPDAINLNQDVNYVIEGAVSGFAILGDITWPISGNALPISQSGLVLRQCAPNSLTIIDGYPISIESTLVLENVFVFNSITQTGTGVFNALISGISTAASSISGPVVSSAIIGNLLVSHANVGITNTQLDGYVSANKLWANSSQFIGGSDTITCTGTQLDLQQCIFANPPTFIFSGSPGSLLVDSITNYQLITNTFTLTNGSKVGIGNNLIQVASSEITVDTTTTSTTFVDLLSTTITTIAHSKLMISFTANFSTANANRGGQFRILIDGVAGRGGSAFDASASGGVSISIQQPKTGLAAGSHTIKVQWAVLGTGTTLQIRPVSNPNTESACLIIQEVLF